MKYLKLCYYLSMLITFIVIIWNCVSISNSFTSAPWYVGIVYPACYFSLVTLCIGFIIYFKYRSKIELISSSLLVLIQLIITFS